MEFQISDKAEHMKGCEYAFGITDKGVILRVQDMRGEQVHVILNQEEVEKFKDRLNFFLAKHLNHLENMRAHEHDIELSELYNEAASQVLIDAIKEKGVTEFGSATVDLSTPEGKVMMATAILET